MSNARNPPRRGQGSRPDVGSGNTTNTRGPAGPPPYARKEKDDLRSKIMKAKSRYEDLCDAVEGQRFRVRAEILENNEDYITVEMGCNLEGVIRLPWQEYASATLEIQYGSKLDLARKVKTMIRRSTERLGYQLDVRSAVALRGSAEESQLLMSNKEWKSFQERQPRGIPRAGLHGLGSNLPPVAPSAPAAPPNGGVSLTGVPGYYAQASAEASRMMEQKFQSLFPNESGPSQQWDEVEESSSSRPGSVVPPPTQQRGSTILAESAHGRNGGNAVHEESPPRVPVPKGPPVFIPAPTTNRGGS
jgi:hypothetical protein